METKGQNVNNVLVVGGGIGGIKAALELAEMGYHVYLQDKAPVLGGTFLQLDKQFPTNDCGMCKILPVFGSDINSETCIRRGLEHVNITELTNSNVVKLEIINRWLSGSKDEGINEFNNILNNLQSSFEFPEEQLKK